MPVILVNKLVSIIIDLILKMQAIPTTVYYWIGIDVFTVISAILDNTPEGNIQGRIKGRDALGLGWEGPNFVKL